MKSIIRILSFFVLAIVCQAVKCQEVNALHRIINESFCAHIERNLQYYVGNYEDSIDYLNKIYVYTTNYPPHFKLDNSYKFPEHHYNVNASDMREIYRKGINNIEMFDIRLHKDTLLIGFEQEKLEYKFDRGRWMFMSWLSENYDTFIYVYDSIAGDWKASAKLQGWWNYNYRHGEFLHNDLYDLINESLYSYLQSQKKVADIKRYKRKVYVIMDGFPSKIKFTRQVIGMIRKILNLNNNIYERKYLSKQKHLPTNKDIYAVALDDLDLRGDTLKISYAWRYVKLLKDNTLSIQVDDDSRKTYFYKYSCQHEKWIPLKKK